MWRLSLQNVGLIWRNNRRTNDVVKLVNGSVVGASWTRSRKKSGEEMTGLFDRLEEGVDKVRSIVEAHTDSADPFTDGGITLSSTPQIRSALQGLTPDQHIEALARALAIGRDIDKDQRLQARLDTIQDRIDAISNAHSKAFDFFRSAGVSQADLKPAIVALQRLFSKEHTALRFLGAAAKAEPALTFDVTTAETHKFAGPLIGLGGCNAIYGQDLQHIERELSPEFGSIPELESELAPIEGYYRNLEGVLADTYKAVKQFPASMIATIEKLNKRVKAIEQHYKDSGEEESDEAANPFARAHERTKPPPIYKGNVLLTALLDSIVQALPESRQDQRKSSKTTDKDQIEDGVEELDSLEKVGAFNLIAVHADPILFDHIYRGTYFSNFAIAVSELTEKYKQLRLVFKATGLDEDKLIQSGDPAKTLSRFSDIMSNVHESLPGEHQNSSDLGWNHSLQRLAELTESLAKLNPKQERQIESAQGEPSRRDETYLELFGRIESLLLKLMTEKQGKEGQELVFKELNDLIELKSKLATPQRSSQRSNLKHDRESGNLCYTYEQRGMMGDLQLTQSPTSNVTYEDIIGASWIKVKSKLEALIEYAESGYVYSHLSARGKSNNNMLIVGPYGCGKNEFLKALMSDAKLIGANLTTDRVVSMWHGKDEQNTRAVFELGRDKFWEFGKPVVVGWDEFDGNFSGSKAHGYVTSALSVARQKILQSVLEGDTVYEGVALIGLTNEPLKIPVPIYRRFANVEVIEALTALERRQLLERMLQSLPLSDDFATRMDWEAFGRATDYASGHVVGKVYDEVFDRFIKGIKADKPGILKTLNAEVGERVEAGERFKAEDRVALFRKHTGRVVTMEDLGSAAADVLSRTDIKSSISQQKIFYRDVKKLMEEAFEGSV